MLLRELAFSCLPESCVLFSLNFRVLVYLWTNLDLPMLVEPPGVVARVEVLGPLLVRMQGCVL